MGIAFMTLGMVVYTVHVTCQDIDGGATEADGGASAPVGPSVAMPLFLVGMSTNWLKLLLITISKVLSHLPVCNASDYTFYTQGVLFSIKQQCSEVISMTCTCLAHNTVN